MGPENRSGGPALRARLGWVPRGLGGKPIAAAAHGLDMPVMTRRKQGLPKPPNVDINGAFLDKNMVSPDMVQQLAAAMDTLGMGHKKMQQPKLGRAQL